jgi:hypothetical protein
MGFFDDFLTNALDGAEEVFTNIENAIGTIPEVVDQGVVKAEEAMQVAENGIEQLEKGASRVVEVIDTVEQKSNDASTTINTIGDKLQGS